MSALKTSILAALVLAGCSGKPFQSGSGGGGSSSNVSVATLPGTTNPSPNSGIERTEAEASNGNGYAQGFTYDRTANTFTVENIAFDGNNVYKPDTKKPILGPAKVFAGPKVYKDDVTGTPIDQFSYRALYGESKTGNSFAIVRTGAYVNYGFGGFIYKRADGNGVTLPTSGEAHYAGDYAGLRDSDNSSSLNYTTGKMTMDMNFGSSSSQSSNNPNGAVIRGQVTDRKIFDLNGTDITASVVSAINTDKKPDVALTALPVLVFTVGPGQMDNNGEMQGTLNSGIESSGTVKQFETGTYYGVLSGDATKGGKDEVVGVIVVTSTTNNVQARETGGFILYRK
jgi:hypothetical protein